MLKRLRIVPLLLIVMIGCAHDGGTGTDMEIKVGTTTVYFDFMNYYFKTAVQRRRYYVTMRPSRPVTLLYGSVPYANGSCLNAGAVIDIDPDDIYTAGTDYISLTVTSCP